MSPPGPPVPVPSKAAIRALRGLVLGTTCSLALVAEDRRRRINAANLAVRNARTIRSASRYHARGGAAVAASALASAEDEGTPSVVNWRHIEDNIRSTIMSTLQPEHSIQHDPISTHTIGRDGSFGSVERSLDRSLDRQALPHRKPKRQGANSHPRDDTASIPSPSTSQSTQPTQSTKSTQSISHAKPSAPTRWYIPNEAPSIADKAQKYQGWIRTTKPAPKEPKDSEPTQQNEETARPEDRIVVEALLGTLAKTCRQSTKKGGVKITEAVQDAIDTAEMISLMPETAAQEKDDPFAKRFSRVVSQFVALLSLSTSTRTADELVGAGQPLLEFLFALKHEPCIAAVYGAIAQYPGRISWFTNWYLQQLDEHGYHSLLVASFLLRPPPPDSLPTALAYHTLCNRVVQAVRTNYNQDADLVLKALVTTRPATTRLDTPWITDLIYGHWTRSRSYSEAIDLFDSLTELSGQPLSEVVEHVDAAYRVMIQISLEAGEAEAAQALFENLVAVNPSSQGNIRILGLFALDKAKKDEWDAVKAYFQTAYDASKEKSKPDDSKSSKNTFAADAEQVVVPIVKEHIKRHTIAETEAFMKMCINDMGFSINREMVTLLANEYGALGDASTFMGWLTYCTEAGFKVDAAFSNAIVQNCRRHWKFSFRDLRTVYRKLKVLSPDFEDNVTQTIMKHSAISDAKHAGAPVRGRVLSLRIPRPASASSEPSSWAPPELVMGRGKRYFASEDDLHVEMKEAFASGHAAKTVRMFTEAMRQGMPPSAKCLALAVSAAVRSGKEKKKLQDKTGRGNMEAGSEFDLAIDLVRAAHRAGHNIGDATAYLAIAHIDAIDCRANDKAEKREGEGEYAHEYAYPSKASVATAVKTVLTRLGEQNYHISGLALNRAAFFLYKSSHLRGALALAQSAAYAPVADGGGDGLLGYDAYNFSILVSVYARMAVATGIRTATDGAVKAGVLDNNMAYKSIKQARRRLKAALDQCNTPDETVADPNLSGEALKLSPLEVALNAEAKSARRQSVTAALNEIERTLDLARTARKKLADYRAEVGPSVIGLMQRAAEAAGRPPVNFDDIPYLRKDTAKWANKAKQADEKQANWDLQSELEAQAIDINGVSAPMM